MKKHFFFALAAALALLTAGCGSTPAGPAGSISGTLSGAEGQVVELKARATNGMLSLASAQVAADGSFQLTPQPGLMTDYYFLTVDGKNVLPIITDSTETLVVSAQANDLLNNPEIQGSPNSTQLHALMAQMRPVRDEIKAQSQRTKDPQRSAEQRSEAKKAEQAARTELQKLAGAFIRENSGSPAALEALSGLSFQRSMKSFEMVLKDLKGSLGHSVSYQNIAGQVENAKKQMALRSGGGSTPGVGQEAPDIVMNDLEGNTRKLSDLRGKVVLIDFWASWCGPCRRENPNVVKAYAEYKDKGFDVFSVSLDKTADRWKAAIEQDGLLWSNHVSDLKGWQNAAAKLYDVHSIPATFLIDQEGKVVASNLRGPALESKLEELLGS